VQWPARFYELKRGEGCPMCAEERRDDVGFGVRFLAGEAADAYLQRAAIQRGYTVVVWRGRHVAEPTELTDEEAAAYWRDVVRAARALEAHFRPVKTNYNTLGNELPHLHTHVILRYADDPKPGWPFPFPDEDPGRWPEDELQRDVAALRTSDSTRAPRVPPTA
jgi:diadenosine tetraphosphate (Ap4A) HIT family hydrolase